MTVNIIDVVPGAITVYADQVAVGDRLFDVFGGTHEVVKANPVGTKGKVRLVRADRWADTFDPDCELAIVPGDGDAGRNLDRSSSGSRQGYIETGRYSSVNEERAINPGSHA